MFPPGESAVTVWSAPRAVSRGLPSTSANTATSVNEIQITNMITNTARPWRLSLSMRPNVNASANGTRRIA